MQRKVLVFHQRMDLSEEGPTSTIKLQSELTRKFGGIRKHSMKERTYPTLGDNQNFCYMVSRL